MPAKLRSRRCHCTIRDCETSRSARVFAARPRRAGRLNDPNVVSVSDYGETDELAYIVMEYVEGTSLDTRLTPGQALPCREGDDHGGVARRVAAQP